MISAPATLPLIPRTYRCYSGTRLSNLSSPSPLYLLSTPRPNHASERLTPTARASHPLIPHRASARDEPCLNGPGTWVHTHEWSLHDRRDIPPAERYSTALLLPNQDISGISARVRVSLSRSQTKPSDPASSSWLFNYSSASASSSLPWMSNMTLGQIGRGACSGLARDWGPWGDSKHSLLARAALSTNEFFQYLLIYICFLSGTG